MCSTYSFPEVFDLVDTWGIGLTLSLLGFPALADTDLVDAWLWGLITSLIAWLSCSGRYSGCSM